MGDLVLVDGVSEQRANEIAEFKAREVLAEYTAEAAPIARARMGAFDSKLVEHFSSEDILGVLGDPAFLVLLRKAQVGAASSEREGDHDLLVRLLAERAQRSGRRLRASVDRAVQVVDHLDDGALQALTACWALTTLTPRSGVIGAGLDTMEQIFRQTGTDLLPTGTWWLDHLDTLDVMRSGPSGIRTLKKMGEYLPHRLAGYVSAGFDYDAGESIDVAIRAITEGAGIDIVAHELKDEGTYRIPIVDIDSIRMRCREAGYGPDTVEAVVEVVASQGRVGDIDPEAVARLLEEIDRRPAFGALRAWWDEIPMAIELTDVGRAVALSNTKRLVNKALLPPLQLGE